MSSESSSTRAEIATARRAGHFSSPFSLYSFHLRVFPPFAWGGLLLFAQLAARGLFSVTWVADAKWDDLTGRRPLFC